MGAYGKAGRMIQLIDTQWLDQDEVLSALQISKSTWMNLRRRHSGPQDGQLRLGRRLYWNQRKLLDWLDDCEVSSDIDAPAPAAAPAFAEVTPKCGIPVAPEPSGYRSRTRGLYDGLGEPVDGRFQ
jgi:hypothetical protein